MSCCEIQFGASLVSWSPKKIWTEKIWVSKPLSISLLDKFIREINCFWDHLHLFTQSLDPINPRFKRFYSVTIDPPRAIQVDSMVPCKMEGMWRFPEIGVPSHHPFPDGIFHESTITWVPPILWKPHYPYINHILSIYQPYIIHISTIYHPYVNHILTVY